MAENIPLVIGVDEAGRGPVLGDMIIGLVCIRRDRLDLLKSHGVVDSKSLSANQRSRLVLIITRISDLVLVTHVSIGEIDLYNLNRLTLEKILYMLDSVGRIVGYDSVETVFIDMVKGYKRYLNRFRKLYPKAEIVFEEDADRKYVVVSAASIIAKYYRDQLISELKRFYGEIGSGYPTDPETIAWIREAYQKLDSIPPFIRRSWRVLKRIAPKWYKAKKVRGIGRQKSILDYLK